MDTVAAAMRHIANAGIKKATRLTSMW